MSGNDGERIRLVQRQIELVLESSEFAGSHRLRDFLRFVCQATNEGRTELDQVEIAASVLGRQDFNPTEDTSVRKLATMARQRLEKYYREQGKLDPVVIVLPQRSYLPRFRFANQPDSDGEAPHHLARKGDWKRYALIAAGCVFSFVLGGAAVHWLPRTSPPARRAGQFTVPARKGSVIYGRTDAPPESLLVGPSIGASDQLVARMVFTPRTEYDQAGIMIYQDPDNYVRLAQHLRRRNGFLFTSEMKGERTGGPERFSEDPKGQTGDPVWLAIRRRGDEFHAFTSSDGWHWDKLEYVVHAALSAEKTRASIYAFSDVESAQPPLATFDHVSIGPAALLLPGPTTPVDSLPGWDAKASCSDFSLSAAGSTALEVNFSDNNSDCNWSLTRQVPNADWSITGIVDSSSWSRTTSGLMLAGSRDAIQILRHEWQGGSIVVTTGALRLFRMPDLPGNPPLVLRLRSEGGKIRGEAGASFDSLRSLPFTYPAADLGANLRTGFQAVRLQPQKDITCSPVGLRFLGFDVLTAQRYR